MKLTVVCRDNSNVDFGYEGVLIYTVDLPEGLTLEEGKTLFGIGDLPNETIRAAILECRHDDDADTEDSDLELLFAFAGDLTPAIDWR